MHGNEHTVVSAGTLVLEACVTYSGAGGVQGGLLLRLLSLYLRLQMLPVTSSLQAGAGLPEVMSSRSTSLLDLGLPFVLPSEENLPLTALCFISLFVLLDIC